MVVFRFELMKSLTSLLNHQPKSTSLYRKCHTAYPSGEACKTLMAAVLTMIFARATYELMGRQTLLLQLDAIP